MLERIRREPCKKVTTADSAGAPNGFLIELYKNGSQTTVYLTATLPKAFKGYHLHTVRASHLVCLKGRMKITVVEGPQRVEHVLDGATPERLLIPTGVWIGYENVGDEEAWMVNFPRPAYDPSLKGEQQEKTKAEIAEQLRTSSTRG
jgi:dTDP-4-dehydrorhamnose 3,5-epimerase-like enzyme